METRQGVCPCVCFWLVRSQPPANFELFFMTADEKLQQLRSDVVAMETKALLCASGMRDWGLPVNDVLRSMRLIHFGNAVKKGIQD